MGRGLGRIYREHREGLYALAMSVTQRPELAEEAVHEAFARLCRQRPRSNGDPVRYVFAAVRNAAIDQVRRRKTRPAQPGSLFDGVVDLADGPEQAACGSERDQRVREAVDRLPTEQREAVVMRIYSGLTFEQMAGVLGEPLSTVRGRYQRALRRLKETVEDLR